LEILDKSFLNACYVPGIGRYVGKQADVLPKNCLEFRRKEKNR
jgi:hypothetical protein